MTDAAVNSYLEADPTGEMASVRGSQQASPRRRLAAFRFDRWAPPDSPVLTYAGVLVAAVGFVLIGVAWSEVAAQSNVALQMPYLVSAGISGLALVMVGLLLVSVAAKRQDSAARARQADALTEAVTQLRLTIEELDSPRNA